MEPFTDGLKLLIQPISRNRIPFENLIFKGHTYGSDVFEIKNGFQPLNIRYNEQKESLTVEGSIPFFCQGHNFGFSHEKLIQSFDLISETLCYDLFDAEVKSFEFGTVLQVELCPDYILKNHLNLAGHNLQPWTKENGSGELSGIVFKSTVRTYKMYDGGYRVKQMKLPKSIKDQMQDYDPKAFYVKVENDVKKADRYLQIRNLSLRNYCTDEMQKRLKGDLIETYNYIQKKNTFMLPEGITKPSVNQLLYLLLCEQNTNIRKEIESKMKALNLDPVTRKNRQRKIREDLKKFGIVPDERIDLLHLICNGIN